MTKNRKYDFKVANTGSTWKAQIIRHITSKKTKISKQKEAFETEAEAREWAEQQLLEFIGTQSASNKRHGEQRKLNEEQRQQRSNRRAEKTENAKLAGLDDQQKSMISETDNSDHS